MSIPIYKDNLLPFLTDTIKSGGVPVDLSLATVKLQARRVGSAALKIDSTASVALASQGIVSYAWVAADVDTVGEYEAWWQVIRSGKAQDTPEFEFTIIEHAPESVVVPSPVATDGSGLTTIYRGDSYSNTYGRALVYQLQVGDAPDLSGLTVKWRVTGVMEKTMTVVGEDAAYVELTSAETTALSVQTYPFEIEATTTGSEFVTLLRGQLVVNPDITHIP